MWTIISVGCMVVALTTSIHAIGTTTWMRYLLRRYAGAGGGWKSSDSLWILITTAIVLLSLHTVEIALWAVVYFEVAPTDVQTVEASVYFSFVTFATLGYGDITLGVGPRLLSGVEALNGIFLVGWSTAMMYSIVQRIWLFDQSHYRTRQQ